jgi:ankyrin repeat protein
LDIITALLDAAASVKAVNSDGKTAFDLASSRECAELIQNYCS